MAWIELHQGLREHKKMFAAAEALNLSRVEMVGTLVCLWLWALDNAPGGSLAGVSNRTLATVCGWPEKKADKLITVLSSTGWLDTGPDGSYRVHDWMDYAGKLMERRAQDNDRKKRARRGGQSEEIPRTSEACPQDFRRTSAGNPQDVRGNSGATVPIPYHNSTTSNLDGANNNQVHTPDPPNAPALKDGFEAFWKAYPNHGNVQAAWEAWHKIAPDEPSRRSIMDALERWKKSGAWQQEYPRFVPPAAKWLRDRRWEGPIPAPAKTGSGGPGWTAGKRELDEAELEAVRRIMAEPVQEMDEQEGGDPL